MKRWYKSRTLWLNVGVAALAAIEMNLGLVRGLLSAEHYLGVVVIVNAVNAALRFATSQPIGSEKA